jgi:uncharacterized protein YndB with AHSA1/START domain
MSSWRQQALIDAPSAAVWELISSPNRFPDWWPDAIEVTGPPTIEKGTKFRQTSPAPIGRWTTTTTFKVEALDELHEIRMRCQQSGWYSHWFLTEARDATFVDVEVGIEPVALQYRLLFGALGKRHFRDAADAALDGLRQALATDPVRLTR